MEGSKKFYMVNGTVIFCDTNLMSSNNHMLHTLSFIYDILITTYKYLLILRYFSE